MSTMDVAEEDTTGYRRRSIRRRTIPARRTGKAYGFAVDNGGVLVLLPRVLVFLISFWQMANVTDAWNHQVSTRQRRAELLVSCYMRDRYGDVSAGRPTADDEAFAWVCAELGGVFGGLGTLIATSYHLPIWSRPSSHCALWGTYTRARGDSSH
jgi:hypothetical protein